MSPEWVPLLLAAGLPLGAFALLGDRSPLARVIAAATGIVLAVRYLAWRWALPLPEGGLVQAGWAWSFLVVETLSTLSSITVLCFMSRRRDRSPEADAWAGSALVDAPTEVFICTYNEGYEILERTILGATRLAHSDLRVWVLDDGARDWVRQLAAELGAHYVRRVKGRHAKAGNVNNGLAQALATPRANGKRPEFILLLDADFVPARHMLQRTLPLFHAADVGIVQTPQHFFNPDPLQSNLLCAASWPDEQRFFFNELLPCKDAWGAAFCCGTSAVFRVAALEEAGGMAVETVTEDMLTTFKLGEYGWRTVFLNERLSLGLAPEGLSEYISQRARWCLGTIQQIYTRWSFAGRGRVSLVNRISCLDGVLYWSVSFLFRWLVLLAPPLFWWFGISTFTATPGDFVAYLAPSMLAGMVFMAVLAGNRVSPILTDVSQLLASVAVLRSVGTALVQPFGHAFKVTAKGRSTDAVVVQWQVLLPFAALALATAGGMLANLGPWAHGRGEAGYALNVLWSLLNCVLLAITIAACVELPRPRREERFVVEEAVLLRRADGSILRAILHDMAVTGAQLSAAPSDVTAGERLELLLDGGALVVPLEVIRAGEGNVAGRFLADATLRRELIAKLYTGSFGNEVEEVAPARALVAAVRRLLG
jgi:cellulose synthase (UDP-forming)